MAKAFPFNLLEKLELEASNASKDSALKQGTIYISNPSLIEKFSLKNAFPWLYDIEDADERVLQAFLARTSELLIIRHACGVTNPTIDCLDKRILSYYPFSVNVGLTVQDILATPNTECAVVFVPLSGKSINKKAILARRYKIGQMYYWQNGVWPTGNSYRLADQLLDFVAGRNDKKLLFPNWVVTGDMDDNGEKVQAIELGNKLGLRMESGYERQRWIMPKVNADAVNLSNDTHIYGVDTLQEATELIFSKITRERDFCRAVERNDEQYYFQSIDVLKDLEDNLDFRKKLQDIIRSRMSGKIVFDLFTRGLFDEQILERIEDKSIRCKIKETFKNH